MWSLLPGWVSSTPSDTPLGSLPSPNQYIRVMAVANRSTTWRGLWRDQATGLWLHDWFRSGFQAEQPDVSVRIFFVGWEIRVIEVPSNRWCEETPRGCFNGRLSHSTPEGQGIEVLPEIVTIGYVYRSGTLKLKPYCCGRNPKQPPGMHKTL